jgi:hypothetical protein
MCQFCGGEIVFRVIHGITTPLHIGDEKCEGRRLYRKEQEGIVHSTRCPRCEASVFFLRHNGGSVWLDSVGWPWPKHPCFENEAPAPSAFSKNAQSFKDAKLVFVKYLGLLRAADGFIVVLLPRKELIRKSPRHRYQWAVVCSRELAEKIGPNLHGKCVFASYEQKRMITMDDDVFELREHVPSYRQRSVCDMPGP